VQYLAPAAVCSCGPAQVMEICSEDVAVDVGGWSVRSCASIVLGVGFNLFWYRLAFAY
jgi:hypothetical protein